MAPIARSSKQHRTMLANRSLIATGAVRLELILDNMESGLDCAKEQMVSEVNPADLIATTRDAPFVYIQRSAPTVAIPGSFFKIDKTD